MAGSTRDEREATLAALRLECEQETARLEEAAERWLDTKASGRDLTAIDAEIRGIDQNQRRLQRKIHRQEKKLRR
jgi:hypothetical protein